MNYIRATFDFPTPKDALAFHAKFPGVCVTKGRTTHVYEAEEQARQLAPEFQGKEVP